MDQREGSGNPTTVPHAEERLPKRGLLMSSLDWFEDMEISGWGCCQRTLLGVRPSQLAVFCAKHNAKPTFPGWNTGFQVCHLDFILQPGFEPVFGPDKKKRRWGPNQRWDKGVAKKQSRERMVMASNSRTRHLVPLCHVISLVSSQHPTVGSPPAHICCYHQSPAHVALDPRNVPPSH